MRFNGRAIGGLLLAAMTLTGCDLFQRIRGGSPSSAVATTPAPPPAAGRIPVGGAASAASFDTVSDAEKAEARAVAASAPASVLGEVTVTLGDPADPGLWVKSALVTEEEPGTVRTGGGDAVAVTLRPLGSDGGAQISLAALRALGLPLAGLFPVTLARTG